jgi:SecD/SecF fusion protein
MLHLREDIKTNSYWAVLGALAVIFVSYDLFRKWQYSLGDCSGYAMIAILY